MVMPEIIFIRMKKTFILLLTPYFFTCINRPNSFINLNNLIKEKDNGKTSNSNKTDGNGKDDI